MSLRISHFLLTSIALSLLLGGCSAIAPAEKAQDQRLDQLIAGMDQCLANQARANTQLQEQELLLGRQQQQLEALAQGLASARVVPVDSAGASPAGIAACPQPEEAPGKLIVGQLEQVWLPNLELALPARIDTGAETASLDARNIELFERDGRRWVRFEILHPQTGDPLPMERKLKRMVAIIQSNTLESERRAVIKLGVTIGHISQTAEFTLSNRSHLDYQLLIGRNILQDVMVVDVSRKNIAPYVPPGDPAADNGVAQ